MGFHCLAIMILIINTACLSTSSMSGSTEHAGDLLPQSLIELKQYYRVIENLEKRARITLELANKEKQLYLQHATKLLKRTSLLSVEEFLRDAPSPGIVSYSNIIAVLAGIVVILASLSVISIYLFPILEDLPRDAWEVIYYVVSFCFMFLTNYSWFIFLGCLGFYASFCYTCQLHYMTEADLDLKNSRICCLTWTIVALFKQSHEAAFLAVIALGYMLNFASFVRDWMTSIGFQDYKVTPNATLSACLLIVMGILLRICEHVTQRFVPFTDPLLYVGTFAYSIGLLILSSRWYALSNRNRDLYGLLQWIIFFSGLAAIFAAPILQRPLVQGVGGTMFIIWVLTKYVQFVPWRNPSELAISLLGFGLLLYGFAGFFKL